MKQFTRMTPHRSSSSRRADRRARRKWWTYAGELNQHTEPSSLEGTPDAISGGMCCMHASAYVFGQAWIVVHLECMVLVAMPSAVCGPIGLECVVCCQGRGRGGRGGASHCGHAVAPAGHIVTPYGPTSHLGNERTALTHIHTSGHRHTHPLPPHT